MDFPLTPSVWLVIAICAVVVATAHAASSSRIHGIGKRETVAYQQGDASSLTCFAGFISTGHKSSRISDRCRSICQDSCRVTGDGDIRVNLGGGIVTASDPIEPVVFLGPAGTRGPPSSDNQIDGTLGRPARPVYTAPLPSKLDFPTASSFTITTTNGELA